MKKYSVFESLREIYIFLAVVFAIFGLNLAYEYSQFSKFKEHKFTRIEAKVQSSYLKTNVKGKTYRVMKLKASDFDFYTTSKKESKFEVGEMLNLGVITDKIEFLEYVKKSFYMPSYKIKVVKKEPNFKDKLIKLITNQHKEPKIKELYAALYLATPISKELRNDVTKWGIAHIIAISGFHLGIIFSGIFLVFTPIYRIFQSRFFPYRSAKFDISVFAFLLMVGYLFLLDFTPSFLRSLVMAVIGFVFIVRNLKIISFQTLFLTILLTVCVYPHLLFSIGFYFSSLGVFYIYLYLHHFKDKFGLFTNIAFLNLYVYFAMNLPVYYFFPTLAFSQIAVIPIGYIFVIFYPVSAFLHLIGQGGLMDAPLLEFLNLHIKTYQVAVPASIFYALNLLSLVAIRYKSLAILVACLGVLPIFLI
ncbi:ComEC/Rec2 family competence protein [Campylobacter geochelonis]|uniref:ComEC/Rec2 family protein n=1 Tax=Campylobacter geochelonis TaxID=1780362 RepID=A0A128EIP4_9BACT|nr:ComEC/Rec2 family competence protein [Campylobacter geochelonis]QKF71616.1 competence protein, ComEC family [Campylobacter geochelonis]CZE48714.1 ComEC/Rec2 family protein [Campylobacter geochelonis]